ncbi:MAG TPA: hypothetical protein VMF88_02910, partial [Bacteroidota bacterium]|nr:hypothetical protein [Bacteroidota bacterium]
RIPSGKIVTRGFNPSRTPANFGANKFFEHHHMEFLHRNWNPSIESFPLLAPDDFETQSKSW